MQRQRTYGKAVPQGMQATLDLGLLKSLTLQAAVLAVHAELVANGVVHCTPGELPEIYCTDEEQERKDCFVLTV